MSKPTNNYLEQLNNTPTPREIHRKWKNIAKQISDFNLTTDDLLSYGVENNPLVNNIMKSNGVTIGDLILLEQARKAITMGDTRAAEFFRDTMGENPKQVVEVQKSTLQEMSDEELIEALEALKNTYQGDNSCGGDNDNIDLDINN